MARARIITRLAPPKELEARARALAVLDAILEPEWEYRYYSFNAKWDESLGQRLATMRNGSGDEWLIAFTPDGAFLKGFAHESPMAGALQRAGGAAQFLVGLPEALGAFATEPSFALEETTFAAWWTGEGPWREAGVPFPADLSDGADGDGAESMLAIVDGDPKTYVAYAREYFEEELELAAVREIYAGRPLTPALVRRIGGEDRAIDDLAEDLAEIGWPRADVS